MWETHVTFCFSVPLGHSKYVSGGSGPFLFIPYKEEIWTRTFSQGFWLPFSQLKSCLFISSQISVSYRGQVYHFKKRGMKPFGKADNKRRQLEGHPGKRRTKRARPSYLDRSHPDSGPNELNEAAETMLQWCTTKNECAPINTAPRKSRVKRHRGHKASC